MTRVDLTDPELLVLDGQCRDDVQDEVNGARARISARQRHASLPPEQAAFVADVVREAQHKLRIKWVNTRIDQCPLCGWRGEYPVYKSGPRRGRIRDNARRKTTAGVELAERFVRIENHVTLGGCKECVTALAPTLAEELRGVEAQVPETLRAEGEPRRVRYERRRCQGCGWEGHEGQMVWHRTLMGDGRYPAQCPECRAAHLPLGRMPFEVLDGYEVVEVEPAEVS